MTNIALTPLRSSFSTSASRYTSAPAASSSRWIKAASRIPISRSLGTTMNPSSQRSSSRSSTTSRLFSGVTGIGIIVTAYSLYKTYFPKSIWPEPIRTPLRSAIKAKMRGDIKESEIYHLRAIQAALSMPSSALSPDPLLKVTGIYISLSSALEASGQTGKAFEALRKALELFGSDPFAVNPTLRTGTLWTGGANLSEAEHIRAIGLSQKLGQLALQISTSSIVQPYPARTHPDGPTSWSQAAETYLSSALTAMLRLGLAARPASSTGPVVVGRDVDLPDSFFGDEAGRVDKRGLGMTLASLSEVYARKGQLDLAGQLLLQAISTLLPPNPDEVPPIADQCQAALLMTTISAHALQSHSPEAIKASRSWSLRCLEIANRALKDATSDEPATVLCGKAKSMGSYNLGVLEEIESNVPEATAYFRQGLDSAKKVGFQQGQKEATDALRRLRNVSPATRSGT